MTDDRGNADESAESTDESPFDPSEIDWLHFDFQTIDETTINTHQRGDVLYFLYVWKGLSQQHIAEYFGVSRPTISRWLNRHGIETEYTTKKREVKLRRWNSRLQDSSIEATAD